MLFVIVSSFDLDCSFSGSNFFDYLIIEGLFESNVISKSGSVSIDCSCMLFSTEFVFKLEGSSILENVINLYLIIIYK